MTTIYMDFYKIKVSGDREKEAAEMIEKTYDFYSRGYEYDAIYDTGAINKAIEKARKEYGCVVTYEF